MLKRQALPKRNDPVKFLEIHPLCDYPPMKKLVVSLKLDTDATEALLIKVHKFEHELIASALGLYAAVGVDTGTKVLDQALLVFADEYRKSKI